MEKGLLPTDLILRHNDRHQPLVGWMELVMLFY